MKVKALRIAAYLLIAHFLIMVGLALVAQGGPDYSRLGFALLLLTVACTALFTPRKRGWLAVVAYPIVVLGQHAVALSAAWSNPGIPTSTKVAAVIVMAVVDALVLAALILVFKPSSFAAFASPALRQTPQNLDEDVPGKTRAAYASPGLRIGDLAIGAAVGAITGLSLGFSSIQPEELLSQSDLKRLFMLPVALALAAFAVLGVWRNAVATTLRDRDVPERREQMRFRLVLLSVAPWAGAAVVLWVASRVMVLIGLVWAVGMMLAVYPTPFGKTARDPLFQAGLALMFSTLAVATHLDRVIGRALGIA